MSRLRIRKSTKRTGAVNSTNRRPATRSMSSFRFHRIVAFLAIVVVGCWLFNWTSRFEVVIVFGFVVLWQLLSALIPRKQDRRRVQDLATMRFQSIGYGMLCGVAAIVMLVAIIALVRKVPAYGSYADRDRASFEAELEVLISSEAFSEAANTIGERLENEVSEQWESELQVKRVEYLTLAGKHAEDVDSAKKYWELAVELGAQYGVDAELAETLLRSAEERAGVETLREQAERAAEESLTRSLASLRDGKQFGAVDVLLKEQGEQLPRERWPEDLIRGRVDNLIAWGDATEDFDLRESKYREAIELAEHHEIDGHVAEIRLREVRTSRRNQPQTLPHGVVGQVTSVDMNGNIGSFLELDVEHAGKFMTGLRRKDFDISIDGQRVLDFEVMSVERSRLRESSVVIALDHSQSTVAVRDDMHAATIRLVDTSPDAVHFRIMRFAEKPEMVTEWTHDVATVETGLKAAGHGTRTALHAAIAAGARELQRRRGRRILVVFSDGHNNVVHEDTQLDDILSMCRDCRVRIIAIGLEHDRLEENRLKWLASHTGGAYFRSGKADEVIQRFMKIKTELSRPVYLVKLYEMTTAHGSLRIRVGRGPTMLELNAQLTEDDSRQTGPVDQVTRR